jgi:hypothetical protein
MVPSIMVPAIEPPDSTATIWCRYPNRPFPRREVAAQDGAGAVAERRVDQIP